MIESNGAPVAVGASVLSCNRPRSIRRSKDNAQADDWQLFSSDSIDTSGLKRSGDTKALRMGRTGIGAVKSNIRIYPRTRNGHAS